jgi:predicted  nucleic acid-binding Zn-ribbon protein
MMEQLALLIRLHNQTLDAKRLEKATIDQQIAQLRFALDLLSKELQQEQQAATESNEARQAYAGYAIQAQERREHLEHELAAQEEKTEILLAAIQEIYADIKRYEKAVADLRANHEAQQRKHEAAQQDEVVTRQYVDQLAEG